MLLKAYPSAIEVDSLSYISKMKKERDAYYV